VLLSFDSKHDTVAVFRAWAFGGPVFNSTANHARLRRLHCMLLIADPRVDDGREEASMVFAGLGLLRPALLGWPAFHSSPTGRRCSALRFRMSAA